MEQGVCMVHSGLGPVSHSGAVLQLLQEDKFVLAWFLRAETAWKRLDDLR